MVWWSPIFNNHFMSLVRIHLDVYIYIQRMYTYRHIWHIYIYADIHAMRYVYIYIILHLYIHLYICIYGTHVDSVYGICIHIPIPDLIFEASPLKIPKEGREVVFRSLEVFASKKLPWNLSYSDVYIICLGILYIYTYLFIYLFIYLSIYLFTYCVYIYIYVLIYKNVLYF